MKTSNKLFDALSFATKAHHGQFRWDGVTHYIEHPKRVVKLLDSWKVANEHILVAGYLHDVLEDTKTTRKDIIDNFGLFVADLVTELTRPKDADYLEHCKKMSKLSALIKLADIFDNLTDTDSRKSARFLQKRLDAICILKEKVRELT